MGRNPVRIAAPSDGRLFTDDGQVRWIKTRGEIDLQKKVADLLDDLLLEVFPTIRAGDLERQVHARLVESCLRHGFGWVHGILNSSSNHVMYGGESDLLFHQGDFVRNDYVAYLNGYAGHPAWQFWANHLAHNGKVMT